MLMLLRLLAPLLLLPASASQGTPQFTRASWTSADGVPGMIYAMAQTPDGYLWLATYEGLYRFDGVSFERVRPAPGHPVGAIPATSVYVTSRGELWVGYAGRGGVEVFRNGRLVRVPMPRPPGEITSLQEDSSGNMWAAGGREPDTLYRFSQGRWSSVGRAQGLPAEFVTSMLSARDSVFWVATRNHLLFLRPGAQRFEDTGERLEDGTSLAEDPRGEIWISGPAGTRMVADYPRSKRTARFAFTYPPVPPVRRAKIIFDHAGAIWGTTYTGGAFRIDGPGRDRPRADPIARFRIQDGLTSNQAVAILEDREHNIWVATEIGLDQFRRAAVTEARLPPRSSPRGFKMASDRGGAIYISNGDRLYRAAPGDDLRLLRSGVDVAALCPDRADGLWIALPDRMELLREGRRARTIPIPADHNVSACAVNGRGNLWIAALDHGVLELSGAGWRRASLPSAVGLPRDIVMDPAGNPIVVFGNRAIASLKQGRSTVIDGSQLKVAGLTGVFSVDGGVLICGGTGVALWDGRTLRRISIDDQPWLRGIRGLVETKLGETWLLSNKGIHRVATSELRAAFKAPRRPMLRTFLGEQDGLRSHTNGDDGPQAQEAGDGRVWFLTRQGPVWIDPNDLPTNSVAPNVIIRGLTAADRHFTDPRTLELEAGTRNLSIDYTALSLSAPNRVSFRYRLEGVDRDWVDPGRRRQAFYTNLGPGTYRFNVKAANDKGIWNEQGATLDFVIAPTFAQTWLFYALCTAAALGLAWLAYLLRVRAIAQRLRFRSAERLDERERIARELHDTLLQGVQALMLRFHVAAQGMEGKTRLKLDAALDQAEEVLVEARERVGQLRRDPSSEELESVILAAIGRQDLQPGTKVGVAVRGTSRPIARVLAVEVDSVVGEALANTAQHARAKSVDVEIAFEPMRVIVSVIDDGIGIPQSVFSAGGRAGHFGLPGMRERARRLGGTLDIRPASRGGTEVRLTVPTFGEAKRTWWSRFLMLLASRGRGDAA